MRRLRTVSVTTLLVVALLAPTLTGPAVAATDSIDVSSLREDCDDADTTALADELGDALANHTGFDDPDRAANATVDWLVHPPDDPVATMYNKSSGGYVLITEGHNETHVRAGEWSSATAGETTLTYRQLWTALDELDGEMCEDVSSNTTAGPTTAGTNTTETNTTETNTTETNTTGTNTSETNTAEINTTETNTTETNTTEANTTGTNTTETESTGGSGTASASDTIDTVDTNDTVPERTTPTGGTTASAPTRPETTPVEDGGAETTATQAAASGDGSWWDWASWDGWSVVGDVASLVLTVFGAFVTGWPLIIAGTVASILWWAKPFIDALLGDEIDTRTEKTNAALGVGGALLGVLAAVVALVAGASFWVGAAVVLILTLPIALIYYIYNYWDTIAGWLEAAGEWLYETGATVAGWIADGFGWLREQARALGGWVGRTYVEVKNELEEFAREVSETIKRGVEKGKELVRKAKKGLEELGERIGEEASRYEEDARKVGDGAGDVGEGLKEMAEGDFDDGVRKMKQGGQKIEEGIKNAGQKIEERAQQGKEYLEEKAQQGKEYLEEKAQQGKEYIQEKAGDAKRAIEDNVNEAGKHYQDGDYLEAAGAFLGG